MHNPWGCYLKILQFSLCILLPFSVKNYQKFNHIWPQRFPHNPGRSDFFDGDYFSEILCWGCIICFSYLTTRRAAYSNLAKSSLGTCTFWQTRAHSSEQQKGVLLVPFNSVERPRNISACLVHNGKDFTNRFKILWQRSLNIWLTRGRDKLFNCSEISSTATKNPSNFEKRFLGDVLWQQRKKPSQRLHNLASSTRVFSATDGNGGLVFSWCANDPKRLAKKPKKMGVNLTN